MIQRTEQGGAATSGVRPTLFDSTDDFNQACPRCNDPLRDRTGVEADGNMLFYRVRFTCPACRYWLCTQLENFNVLGPAPREGAPTPAYLSPADQRIRLDLTQMVVRQFMPAGVESYEAGRVWLSGEGVVSKTWSQFRAGGLHLCLMRLAGRYFQQEDVALELRAVELAADALRAADKDDPALSAADPENARRAGLVLARLAQLYQGQGRQDEAEALLAEANGLAPKLFDCE